MFKWIPACCCMVAFFITAQVMAQDSLPVRFSFGKERISGKELLLKIKADIQPDIRLYGLKQTDEDILYSSISFDSSSGIPIVAKFTDVINAREEKDETIGTVTRYFVDSAVWQQTIPAKEQDSFLLKGAIEYMYKKNDEFIPGKEEFKIFIQPGLGATTNLLRGGNGSYADRSMLWIFLAACG